MFTDATTFATALANASPAFILAVAWFVTAYAYWNERKKCDKLHSEILSNSKEMVGAIGNVQQAIQGFRESMLTVAMLQQRTVGAVQQQTAEMKKDGGKS